MDFTLEFNHHILKGDLCNPIYFEKQMIENKH